MELYPTVFSDCYEPFSFTWIATKILRCLAKGGFSCTKHRQLCLAVPVSCPFAIPCCSDQSWGLASCDLQQPSFSKQGLMQNPQTWKWMWVEASLDIERLCTWPCTLSKNCSVLRATRHLKHWILFVWYLYLYGISVPVKLTFSFQFMYVDSFLKKI